MTQQDLQLMVVRVQFPGGIQLIVCLLGKRLYGFWGRAVSILHPLIIGLRL